MSKILEMRQKRAEVWDKARAFLDERTNESGVMSAEDSQQYERMEQEVVDLGHTIDRMERAEQMDREMKIKSPSQVFRDEVGVMTMRGFGAGVLKESKEQAKVIRNASRFLTGEAQTGAIVTNSSDNSKTYNSNVSSTIQVQQMMVRDEQDIRSLAVEIATLTRRQQRGKGLRMA